MSTATETAPAEMEIEDDAPGAGAAPGFSWSRVILPMATAALFLVGWHIAVVGFAKDKELFPTPWKVVLAVKELAVKGILFNYIVSSLFRVTVGFALAVIVGVPFGLLLGWLAPLAQAFNPLIQ